MLYGMALLLIQLQFAALGWTQSLPKTLYPIIPQPAELSSKTGQFQLNAETRIWVDSNQQKVKAIAAYFADRVEKASGFQLAIQRAPLQRENIISLFISDQVEGKEAYHLKVVPGNISIIAREPAGLFYGIQSLLQLLPPEIYGNSARKDLEWKIPAVEIKDAPRFSYRGMHLDVGRHFFPAEDIKRYIDYLALHKMNTFHWHLTEDQGWRIEIKKYPKLTEIGAWRKGTLKGHAQKDPALYTYDQKIYGGYYSQEEIREIVAYASERYITVIPEIELPGHALAALAAYPEFACTEGPFEVGMKWGVEQDVFCPKEETFEFLENVLTEVMTLFPSEYIHIGGDECPKDRWKTCSHCQSIIQAENLEDEHELQSWFIHRIEKFLNSKDRKLLGWDDILEGGLSKTATVMYWRGWIKEVPSQVIEAGNDLIMSPTSHCYFDFYQSQNEDEPMAIGGDLSVKKVYDYEPVPDGLTTEQAQLIKGAQANIWTEYMPTFDQVEYMLLPRLSALSEVVWSEKPQRDYQRFEKKMDIHFQRLDFMGVNYARHLLIKDK